MLCTCPCCGYISIEAPRPGTYEICPICYWEDDPIQLEYPDYEGGANPFSLRQSRQNYISIGACDAEMLPNVRPADETEGRDPEWSLLPPA